MGYIEDLRGIVGHRTLLLTGVGVGVFNEKGEILLQKNFDDNWGIPGGFMELGESAEEAGRREVLEETGIRVGRLELLTVVSGKQTFKVLKNHDAYYSVTIVYVSKEIIGGTLKADGIETTDAKFFGIDNLPEILNPMIASIIQHYAFMKK